jgi:hypothetical protein
MPPILKQDAAFRTREGGFHKQGDSAVMAAKSQETQAERRRGRPPGSKSKPKQLIPTELASELLDAVKPLLPAEHYSQMKKAVKDGKAMSTLNEARVMLQLMSPSIMKRLIEEQNPNLGLTPEQLEQMAELGPRQTEFRKDTNERIQIWMRLLEIVHKMETAKDASEGHSKNQPLTSILVKRGLDAGRLTAHLGGVTITVGGDDNGVGGEASDIRTVSDYVPERPLDVPDSEQESSIRILDNVEYRDDS